MDVELAAKEIARPHDKESAGGATGAEDTICGRNDIGSGSAVPGFTFSREIEVREPARLADGAGDDGRTISVRLGGMSIISRY